MKDTALKLEVTDVNFRSLLILTDMDRVWFLPADFTFVQEKFL